MQTRRHWKNIFSMLKDNFIDIKILCSVKIVFKNENKIRIFSGKQKLREFLHQQTFTKGNVKMSTPGKIKWS